MATAEELIVAIRSEGVSDTQDQLEGVEQSMQDTAERAGTSAEELSDFSERFQGAMAAAVTALAVGAAGLLSTVPVLGEAFSGLAAIVQALAFQMDGVLRPVLNPLTRLFYDIADAIYTADGVIGDLVGVLTTFASIATVLIAAIATIGSQLGAWASIGVGVVAILKTIGGVIAGVISAISATAAAIAIAIAAIVGFAAAYLTNWRGIRDKTNQFVGEIVDFVVTGFNSLTSTALQLLDGFVSDVVSWFTSLTKELSEWAGDIQQKAYSWGRGLIESFIDGIRSILSRVQDFLGDLQNVAASVGVDVPDLGGFGGGGGSTGGRGGGSLRFRRGTSTGGSTYLDGRQLSESTGRYRSDPSRRRGL